MNLLRSEQMSVRAAKLSVERRCGNPDTQGPCPAFVRRLGGRPMPETKIDKVLLLARGQSFTRC
jgi:hypothetical protein